EEAPRLAQAVGSNESLDLLLGRIQIRFRVKTSAHVLIPQTRLALHAETIRLDLPELTFFHSDFDLVLWELTALRVRIQIIPEEQLESQILSIEFNVLEVSAEQRCQGGFIGELVGQKALRHQGRSACLLLRGRPRSLCGRQRDRERNGTKYDNSC